MGCAGSGMTPPPPARASAPRPVARAGRARPGGAAGGGGEDRLGDDTAAGERGLHRLRPLGEERPRAHAQRSLGQLAGRLHLGRPDARELGPERLGHARPARLRAWPWRLFRTYDGKVSTIMETGGQAAALVDSAPAAGGSAFFATSTSAEKAGGSDTASSASMRRSTSTPAALRPCTNRL